MALGGGEDGKGKGDSMAGLPAIWPAPEELAARLRPSPEETALAGMDPLDALRLSRELQNKRVYTPEQAAANRLQTLTDVGHVIPVLGNVMSAHDAVNYWSDAATNADELEAHKSTVLGQLSALGAITGLPFGRTAAQVAKEAPDTLPVIFAYHGSPHDFNDFKLDKIGTGEGAQAYGHGLYFAENPATAISYREALAKKHQLNPQQGNLGDIRSAVDWLNSGRKGESPSAVGQHIDDAIHDLRSDYIKGPFPNPTDAQIAAHLEGNFAPRGRLYHTELDVNHEDLLDWDKPLSQQSEKVRVSLAKLGLDEDTVKPYPRLDSPITGERILRQLQVNHQIGPDEATSKLYAAGIPGIRYLDQGSRDAGKGTSNYVIFDDKLAKILSKE